MDIFPFSTGNKVELAFSIEPGGRIDLSLSTYDFDPSMESSIIESCDEDSSGVVDPDEIERILDPLIMGLTSKSPVRVDGSTSSPSLEYDHEGLLDSSPLKISMLASLEADLSEGSVMVIDISPFRSYMSNPSGESLAVDLLLSLPDNWEFIPMSITPVELGNYLSLDKRKIEFGSDDPASLDMIATGIHFEIRYETDDDEPPEEPVVYEEVPAWVYAILVLAFIGIAFLIIKFSWRKEPPPEGF
jgi:hypothetical protein